jgi:methylmalonyl-CoA/ethylmalonyl-CoA epimerase
MSSAQSVLQDFITGTAHVGFITDDLELALSQLERVYGLPRSSVTLVPEPGTETETRFAFFEIGGLAFEYIQPLTEQASAQLLNMPSGGGGINHIAWLVSDMDAALTALAAANVVPGHVTPDGPITIGPKRMVYLDPASCDGMVIELIQWLHND